MVVKNFFDIEPLLDGLLANFILTVVAEVDDLSQVRVARVAEVLEEDVDDEVVWNPLVFSDVFRTQLHLACFDVIASLDEGCIEHESADGFC